MLCILFVFLLLFENVMIYADSPDQSNIKIILDDKEILSSVPPIIMGGYTLIQAKTIFEALGASISWDAKTRVVTGVKNDITVSMKIGSAMATVNREEVSLDVPAILQNNCTMVPLRFVAESFQLIVYYDESTKTIYLSDNDSEGTAAADGGVYVWEGVYRVSASTLGKAQLTEADIKSLGKNSTKLQSSIKTIEDVVNYLSLNNFVYQENYIRLNKSGLVWIDSRDPESVMKISKSNCGETAWLINFLLNNDYEKVGFICTYRDMRHVFNYIIDNGKTFVVDLMPSSSEYNTNVPVFEVDSLQAFADYFSHMQENVNVLVSYTANRCLPSYYFEKCGILYLPSGYEVDALYTGGHKVDCSIDLLLSSKNS
jgi:hypothetical protein